MATIVPVRVIDDAFVLKMLSSKLWLDGLPMLRPFALRAPAKAKKTSCGGCQANKPTVLAEVRAALAGLSSDQQAAFKKLAGARTIKIHYRDAKKRISTATF